MCRLVLETAPMTLKIAYISDERFPSLHTDVQQVVKTIDALGGLGATVHLIQPRLARHLFVSKEQRKARICDYFNVEGRFELRDILLWPASDLRVEKFFHGLAAPLKAALGDYDVVYTRNLLPLVATSQLGLPVLFETYRALPISDPRAWGVVRFALRGKRFLGISTHSAYAKQVMVDSGVTPELIGAIPNGYDPSDFDSVPGKSEVRKKLSWSPDRNIALYAGHIRKDKGMDSILELAEDLPDTLFVLVGGNEQETAELAANARARQLDNVLLTGRVAIKDVPLYLTAADVLLIPPTAQPLKVGGRTVLPMKVFTYLAAGRAILAPDLPDTSEVLKHEHNSLRVEPDDRQAAAQSLKRLFEDKTLAEKLSQNARLDAQGFTWGKRAERLLEFIAERLNS